MMGSLYGLATKSISGVQYNLAVDDSGQVFGATGNGTSWSLYASGMMPLFGVTIGANGYAFVCGSSNKIYRSSSPLFSSWSNVGPTIGTTIQFNDVSTLDGVNIIAVGSRGTVYYSSSSGSLNTWTAGTSGISGPSAVIFCVAHATTTTAFAAGGSGYVARTTNGGAAWTRITTIFSSSVTIRFHAISIYQSSNVFIVGSSGDIYWSSDTGTTWSLLASTGKTLYSIGMYDLTYGVAGAVAGSGLFTLVSSKFDTSPTYLVFYDCL
jgi:hypothetical protein